MLDIKNMSGSELRIQIQQIRNMFLNSVITFEQGEEQAKEYINEINKRSQEISKEYGKKYRPKTFANLCR